MKKQYNQRTFTGKILKDIKHQIVCPNLLHITNLRWLAHTWRVSSNERDPQSWPTMISSLSLSFPLSLPPSPLFPSSLRPSFSSPPSLSFLSLQTLQSRETVSRDYTEPLTRVSARHFQPQVRRIRNTRKTYNNLSKIGVRILDTQRYRTPETSKNQNLVQQG